MTATGKLRSRRVGHINGLMFAPALLMQFMKRYIGLCKPKSLTNWRRQNVTKQDCRLCIRNHKFSLTFHGLWSLNQLSKNDIRIPWRVPLCCRLYPPVPPLLKSGGDLYPPPLPMVAPPMIIMLYTWHNKLIKVAYRACHALRDELVGLQHARHSTYDFSYTKMHSVSWRVVTWRNKWNLGLSFK